MSSEAAVRCEEVIRIYRSALVRHRALRGISLEVAAGERLCITGTSGSGKSTLLQIIAGLDRPTSGQVTVFGQVLGCLGEAEMTRLRKKTMGFVFQDFGLLNMSAAENVAFPLLLQGMPQPERLDLACRALREAGLGAHLHHRPGELSGGQKQRVAIARAMITRPPLLLCDEPTGNLDSRNADMVMSALRETAEQQGTTLIVVTHDLERAKRCATRTVHIHDGMLEGAEA